MSEVPLQGVICWEDSCHRVNSAYTRQNGDVDTISLTAPKDLVNDLLVDLKKDLAKAPRDLVPTGGGIQTFRPPRDTGLSGHTPT